MIDPSALLADLKAQVRWLEDDLRERSEEVEKFDTALHSEWRAALQAERTAATYETWREGPITQAAVAWILGTVFVRFCEDNGLIDFPYLAGPGDRLKIASERQQEFFAKNPTKTDRDWIAEAVEALAAASPVAAGLFDHAHNPMWQITPSHDAAKALLAFWRTPGEDGAVVHDFTDPEWDTRFLGDLYQDLSEHAKKTYALLQTPEFVEEFILDLTLKPALDEFGLEPDPPEARPDLPRGLRLIDPTCGSGHFLLGAFKRLLTLWEESAPGADRWDLINRVLYSVHGVDKNPFAVAIARFRLLIAAMRAGDLKRFVDTPHFTINVAVGDSLLHGRGTSGTQEEIQDELFVEQSLAFTYATEDIFDYVDSSDLLGRNSYHVVVGNPPYINVEDAQERNNYRKAYASCSGKYSLSIPFVERFFQLAIRGEPQGAGHIGQITSNSFMKREFGEKLVREFFPTVDLTHVIDGSGAYIPGHGTPTVTLIGRKRWPRPGSTVRTARSVNGEPRPPKDPKSGLVWNAIVTQIDKPGSASHWINVEDLDRARYFGTHPWILAAGGLELVECMEQQAKDNLGEVAELIGIASVTGEDDLYLLPTNGAARRLRLNRNVKSLVTGDTVRDFSATSDFDAIWVYNDNYNVLPLDEIPDVARLLGTYRAAISKRRRFGTPMVMRGLTWYEWQELYVRKLTTPLTITYAEVQTHNHFALSRGGQVFKQTAPVIKLPKKTDEATHLGMIALLNSSASCFWLQQMCHCKGSTVDSVGARQSTVPWDDFYQFNGRRLKRFPLSVSLPQKFGQELDSLAQQRTATTPSAVAKNGIPTRDQLKEAKDAHTHLRTRMIALQEELDWEVYRLYGLITENEAVDLQSSWDFIPELSLGERAFEIVLARKMAAGEVETQWFVRHGSTPITEVPSHWPEEYKRVVEKRIELIEKRPRTIGLIERPEYKRRWQTEPWEKKEKAALRGWLLDRCESRDLWYVADETGGAQARPMTVNRLADKLRGDADFVSVARLYAGGDADLADVLAEIIEAEHVPYLAQLRYKESGLRKRAQWERTWDQQREEDATGRRLDIQVPPKYGSADFLRTSYWRNRGKLDVPKERFISYPGAGPDGDDTVLLGWAGWDHREQAHALMTLIEERSTRDGWGTDRLQPLIAGLAEALPWVRQWHGEVDPNFGMSPADAYAGYLEDQQQRHGLSAEDLAAWRPPKTGRGRRRKTAGTTAAGTTTMERPTLDRQDET